MSTPLHELSVALKSAPSDECDRSAGQPSAPTVEQAYEAHFDFVWTNARRLGVPVSSIDDVVQDVFVVVHRRMTDYDPACSLRAWLFGILLRVVRDHRRSFRRKGALLVPLESDPLRPLASDAPTPSESAERAQQVALLEALLAQLDVDKRSLLILSVFEQWTLREIAESLGSNTNAVHWRLRAAKRELQVLHARWLAGKGGTP